MGELVRVEHLKKYFSTPKGMLHAVEDISFSIQEGETLGIVGESGCGKSTLGRTIMHLLDSTDGTIYFMGRDVTHLNRTQLSALRQNMQFIFQDPYSSINPRMTVQDIIAEPLLINKWGTRQEIYQEVYRLMEKVGLSQRLANSYPHELDGGRRQRIGIARALALHPKFIICDEPVSALDVSIQAQVINLLQDLQDEFGLTYIFVTHDLSVVKHISNRILVMYLGCMVELASSDELFAYPLHPYTKGLLSAIPQIDIDKPMQQIVLHGEIASPINPKPGCRFVARCPYAVEKCSKEQPSWREIRPGHCVACHCVEEINWTLLHGEEDIDTNLC